MNKRFIGFTLAEVLITLGIIGIVAQLTIPALVNSYQNKIYATKLEKFYSTYTGAMSSIMQKYECLDLECAGVLNTKTDFATWRKNFDTEMKSALKIVKSNETGIEDTSEQLRMLHGPMGAWQPYFSTSGNVYVYETIDGVLVWMSNGASCAAPNATSTSNLKMRCSWLLIDINSSKPPNQYGRDVFSAYASIMGPIMPDYSSDYAKLASGSSWESSGNYWKTGGGADPCSTSFASNESGAGCFARIMEEGWKMDY